MDAVFSHEEAASALAELAALNPVGSIGTREQLRNAIVTGIDSALTGFWARFLSHDSVKVLQAQRALFNVQDDYTNALLDKLLTLYFQQP